MPKPDIDTYLTFWASLDETDRMDFTAEALEIARAEKLNLLNADMWETLGWVFADRASSPADRDVAVTGVRRQADGSVIVEGSAPIRDLNRVMAWDLPDEEATTIAGLVIHEARAIPEQGQKFAFHGFRFEVLRKQRNRITLLRLTPEQEKKG